jgi:hypothetical protein
METNSKLLLTTPSSSVQHGGEAGITTPKLELPPMPAVPQPDAIYDSRVQATADLTKLGNGTLSGGGRRKKGRRTLYKKKGNHVTKVMRGCSRKYTKKYKGKRIFRGGAEMVPPSFVNGKISVPIPESASSTQVEILKSLTGGLMDAQVAASNIPPSPPKIIESKFSGGGILNKSKHRSKKTKHRMLRYKKSIGRKSRSRHYKNKK